MERQHTVKLVTPTEVRAVKKGQRSALRTIILARFGEVPAGLERALEAVTSGKALDRLIRQAATVGSASEFMELLV